MEGGLCEVTQGNGIFLIAVAANGTSIDILAVCCTGRGRAGLRICVTALAGKVCLHCLSADHANVQGVTLGLTGCIHYGAGRAGHRNMTRCRCTRFLILIATSGTGVYHLAIFRTGSRHLGLCIGMLTFGRKIILLGLSTGACVTGIPFFNTRSVNDLRGGPAMLVRRLRIHGISIYRIRIHRIGIYRIRIYGIGIHNRVRIRRIGSISGIVATGNHPDHNRKDKQRYPKDLPNFHIASFSNKNFENGRWLPFSFDIYQRTSIQFPFYHKAPFFCNYSTILYQKHYIFYQNCSKSRVVKKVLFVVRLIKPKKQGILFPNGKRRRI